MRARGRRCGVGSLRTTRQRSVHSTARRGRTDPPVPQLIEDGPAEPCPYLGRLHRTECGEPSAGTAAKTGRPLRRVRPGVSEKPISVAERPGLNRFHDRSAVTRPTTSAVPGQRGRHRRSDRPCPSGVRGAEGRVVRQLTSARTSGVSRRSGWARPRDRTGRGARRGNPRAAVRIPASPARPPHAWCRRDPRLGTGGRW